MNVRCRDLGRMEYEACWELQRSLFEALLARKAATAPSDVGRTAGRDGDAATAESEVGRTTREEALAAGDASEADQANKQDGDTATAESEAGTVLLVEHPPVYTLGKSGRAENLLIGREALEKMGARFFHIDRGGDITFHGPGQLVCYPILDLERLGMGLREYIAALEETVIRTVGRYGIRASRLAGAAGVWINPESSRPRKICAIGVRSSRYVTMHGFALNVSTDLRWFARINPCGFTDRGVASIESETGLRVAMDEVKPILLEELAATLGCRIEAAF